MKTLLWALTAFYLALVIIYAWNPTPFAQLLAAIGIGCALSQAVLAYGWRDALAFLAICLGVTFAMENIGVATGFPFGEYHFTVGSALPHVGAIPIIVGPLWFGMGYFSWMVARTLLGDGGTRPSGLRALLLLPATAACVMTAWDLVMDPPQSTISHAWIWHQGGADFGVPLSNYFGWLLTSWLLFQLFALYLRRRPAIAPALPLQLAAILFYACTGLTHIVPWLMGQNGVITDASGHAWRIEEIRRTAVLVMACTMLPITILALLRLARPRSNAKTAATAP